MFRSLLLFALLFSLSVVRDIDPWDVPELNVELQVREIADLTRVTEPSVVFDSELAPPKALDEARPVATVDARPRVSHWAGGRWVPGS